jgi:hypothetical protein
MWWCTCAWMTYICVDIRKYAYLNKIIRGSLEGALALRVSSWALGRRRVRLDWTGCAESPGMTMSLSPLEVSTVHGQTVKLTAWRHNWRSVWPSDNKCLLTVGSLLLFLLPLYASQWRPWRSTMLLYTLYTYHMPLISILILMNG